MAQAITPDTVLGLIKSGMAPAVSRLTSTAISWLGVFAVIQFIITNFGLLKSDGDLQAVIAKLTASIAWIGVCLYIINNGPDFIQAVGDEMMGLVGFELPSASGVVAQTVKLSAVMASVAVAASAAPFVGNTIGTLLLYISIGLLIVGLLFAFKVFMLQLELGLIALLAPLSFAFLGLSTLKDQGIAPFKSLLSFAYRTIILTVILSAFGQVSEIVVSSISDISASTIITNGIGNIVDTILSAMGAYLLLAFLVWKSDAIASSMASGSTSLGNSDIASAAAAGAAAGAVVASAGAAAAGGAAQAPQTMADFMSKFNGGGSISNAGGMGSGGGSGPAPFTPPASASMSRGGPSTSNSASSGSTGPTNASSSTKSGKPAASPSGSVASGRYGTTSPSSAAASNNAQTGQVEQADQATQSNADASMSIHPAETSNSAAGSQHIASGNGSNFSHSSSKPSSIASPSFGSSPPEVQGGSSSNANGSASTASIGSSEKMQQTLDDISKSLNNQGQKKPTLKDHLGQANQQVERERDATHVHINTHHTD